MRRTLVVFALVALALCLAPIAAADATRTLKVEIPASAGRFAVENLAGFMRITPGSEDTIVAVATVHAESDELADSVRFEKVQGAAGVETYRVRYPYDTTTTFRYPGSEEKGSMGWIGSLFGGSNTTTKYDGRNVKISNGGTMVYADIEVRVPRHAVDAIFRNLVGRIEAADLEGKLVFDSATGPIGVERVQGEVKADTGSGDVKASRLHGSFTCDTGSGNCTIDGFDGDVLRCDVGSGDIKLSSIHAHAIRTDTGSGDVRAVDVDVEEIVTDSGSGDVDVALSGSRLVRVKSEAGSGDLMLRFGGDASFEAYGDQGSGDIVNRFSDAQPIVKGKSVIGYRRGDAKARIDFEAGSGDLILQPGS